MQYSLRNLIIAIAVIAFFMAIVGTDSKKGSVIVGQQNSRFVESVLAEHGIHSYEAYSSSGVTRYYFLDANERSSTEDAIERDALERGYSLKIKHRTIIPPFYSERIVNADIGMSGHR